MPSLSVLCPTNDPPERVAALLEPLRAVAGEVLVAVDSRVDTALLPAYAAAADRILRFEYGAPDSSLAALHARCRGDWVLTIAGDEVASAELVAQLPELIAKRDVLQYWLPMRWIWPDAGHWLDELPWHPDFHNRLVRNDGTLHFPGRMHEGAAPALPARWIDAPLYHLNLVVQTEAERLAKAERNERGRPGLVAPAGGPFNEVYYVPERHASLAPRRVPQADRAAIAAVLGATPPSGTATGLPFDAPLVTAEEIRSRWALRELAPGAVRATIEGVERDPRMHAGEHRAVHVRLRNDGAERWPGLDRQPLIRARHRLLDLDGGLVAHGAHSPLPHEVEPGASCIAPLAVTAPSAPGRFLLEIDLVHGEGRSLGCAVRLPLVVGEGTERAAPPGRRGLARLLGRYRTSQRLAE